MKRGLKDRYDIDVITMVEVALITPMKRGLKGLYNSSMADHARLVALITPMKRGLKDLLIYS